MASGSHRITFFRQTGWMALATGVGGMLMWLGVHVPAQAQMPRAEYGVFLALLQVMNLMLIPAIGLQTVFAQQTAAAITPEQQAELSYTVRRLLLAAFLLWLAMASLAFGFRHAVLSTLKITDPMALWFTLLIGLALLWSPIFQGILQGRQNFVWLGWLQIMNGGIRCGGVVVAVCWLGWYTAGAVGAALLGFATVAAFAGWHTRVVWLHPGRPVAWRGWLARVIPLTLGLGASQFMMAADQVVVQSMFDENITPQYGAAGMIGRALVFLTAALVAVMFPKIVRSAARAEKTDVAALALGATAVVGGMAGLVCTFAPELPLWIINRQAYLSSAPLVPWFVWCMLPLTLATVLINNLLARDRFACVPWLLVVAGGYGAALLLGRALVFRQVETLTAFRRVVQTLGLFSLLLLGVAAWFTWGPRWRSPAKGMASSDIERAGGRA